MAHGAADDSNIRLSDRVYIMSDLGELAARLGSIVTFNRLGNVLFLEDFETGLGAWQQTIIGAGSSIAIVNTNTFSGLGAVQLISQDVGLSGVTLYKYLPIIDKGKIGVSWRYQIIQDIWYSLVTISHGLAGVGGLYRIKHNPLTGELGVYHDGGFYTIFGTHYPQEAGVYGYHQGKLVVDVDTEKYVRLYLDDKVYDLRDYGRDPWMLLVEPRLQVGFDSRSNAGDEGILNLDNIFVTFNEV